MGTVWDSIVGIVTCYRLNGPGIKSLWGARFFAPVQTGLALGAQPASCTMDTELFSCGGVKWLGCGIDHPPPFWLTGIALSATCYLYDKCCLLQKNKMLD